MSEPNYHTTNTKTFFTEHLLAIEMKKKKKKNKKTEILTNKPVTFNTRIK